MLKKVTEEITKSSVKFRREDEFLGMFGALQSRSHSQDSGDEQSDRSLATKLEEMQGSSNDDKSK